MRGAPGSLVGNLSDPFPEVAVAPRIDPNAASGCALSDQRREALRTTLWVVPAIELARGRRAVRRHLRARPGRVPRQPDASRPGSTTVRPMPPARS